MATPTSAEGLMALCAKSAEVAACIARHFSMTGPEEKDENYGRVPYHSMGVYKASVLNMPFGQMPVARFFFTVASAVIAFESGVSQSFVEHADCASNPDPGVAFQQGGLAALAELQRTIDEASSELDRVEQGARVRQHGMPLGSMQGNVEGLFGELAGVLKSAPGSQESIGSCDDWVGAVQMMRYNLNAAAHFQLSSFRMAVGFSEVGNSSIGVARATFHRELGFLRHTVVSSILDHLAQLVAPRTELKMVEVGVNDARHAEYLLVKHPNLRYLGVDPYFDGLRRYFEARLRLSHFGRRAHLLRMASEEGAPWIQDGSLDLIWIDGSHDYVNVVVDLRVWIPKVRKGGFVAGHDYTPVYPGVIQAVHELLDQYPAVDGTLHVATDDSFFWQLP